MLTSVVFWIIYKFSVWDVYFFCTVEYKQVWYVVCLFLWYWGIKTNVVYKIFTSVVLWNIYKCGVWDVYICGTVEYIQVWCVGCLLLWYCGIYTSVVFGMFTSVVLWNIKHVVFGFFLPWSCGI